MSLVTSAKDTPGGRSHHRHVIIRCSFVPVITTPHVITRANAMTKQ